MGAFAGDLEISRKQVGRPKGVGTEPVQGFLERLKGQGLIEAARVCVMKAQGLGATAIAKALSIWRGDHLQNATSDVRVRGGRVVWLEARPKTPSPRNGREFGSPPYRSPSPAIAARDYWATAGLMLKPGVTVSLICGRTKWRR
jgi:hypothetical protein